MKNGKAHKIKNSSLVNHGQTRHLSHLISTCKHKNQIKQSTKLGKTITAHCWPIALHINCQICRAARHHWNSTLSRPVQQSGFCVCIDNMVPFGCGKLLSGHWFPAGCAGKYQWRQTSFKYDPVSWNQVEATPTLTAVSHSHNGHF